MSPNPIGIFFFKSAHIAAISPYKKITKKNTMGLGSCDKINIQTKHQSGISMVLMSWQLAYKRINKIKNERSIKPLAVFADAIINQR